jgi:HlyD family secretion protein
MKNRRLPLVLLLLVAAAAGLAWWLAHRGGSSPELLLYGNVDLREVTLAFNGNERIAEVLVQEGDRVRKGQVLARLVTNRLEPQVGQADAVAAAQSAVVERLLDGTRPEEVAEARAGVAAAQADADNAERQLARLNGLAERSGGRAVGRQDLENAAAARDMAAARLQAAAKALALAVAGPRREDIGQAKAQLRADEAQLAYLRQELADAELAAPADAVVRTRLLEPGEMASPQRPVYSLALTDPKWVRAYVSEPDLGAVKPGLAATVTVDSFPGRRFEGWVGFVSPVAEFTPKTVETDELRTSLVYEVRVFVKDPGDTLRLGMPATVHLPRPEPAREERQ